MIFVCSIYNTRRIRNLNLTLNTVDVNKLIERIIINKLKSEYFFPSIRSSTKALYWPHQIIKFTINFCMNLQSNFTQ